MKLNFIAFRSLKREKEEEGEKEKEGERVRERKRVKETKKVILLSSLDDEGRSVSSEEIVDII